ncbi:hypothetical protein M409DRAFT_50447 [Zasmidium cellare ATCC 36951]|uniref:Uncharacterized protein n=1 Tax=Zasmidium cellare ATCC 36951 TaxID=1080233 RepID=A0A6A6D134_ZASCE|nr:uncharacterized protein M409DRAFT_50447 [Zasmidium cellare ATCC 36951]KAF2171809.1 hypothetical protein M409DRAFT_50447 [Zasmidium cellare ATCC 36951]
MRLSNLFYLMVASTSVHLGRAHGQNTSTDASQLTYEAPRNGHLSKRVFSIPNENTLEAYTQWMANEATKPTTHRLRDANEPEFADHPVDIGSTSEVHVFGREVISASVTDLNGCTSVIVVSKRGLYISHLFEVPSFKAKTEGGRVIVPESFDKDVKHDLIKGGTAKDPNTGKALMRGLAALKSTGLPFHEKTADGGENLIAFFIVTPRHISRTTPNHRPPRPMEHPDDLQYSDKVQWIHKALADLFPQSRRREVIQYEKRLPPELNNPNDQNRAACGKILFQYDPYAKDVTVPDRRDESGRPCKVQAAGFRLWFMERPRPADVMWAAELDQRTFGKQTKFPRRWLWERGQKNDVCDMKGKTLEESGFN